MSEYKNFLTSLIIISFVIQISSLMLNKTSFSKLFKTVSGILLIITIISAISQLFSYKSFEISYKTDDINYTENQIKQSFENNLKQVIEDDLHKKGYVNTKIDVQTDMEFISISVYGSFDENRQKELETYLKDTYCTPNDEVIIRNENT